MTKCLKLATLFAVIQFAWTTALVADSVSSNPPPAREDSENSQGLKVVPPNSTPRMPSISVTRARKIDPSAKPLLDEVQKSYQGLQRVDLSGDFSVTIQTTGVVHSVVRSFTSSFERPNKFRHEMNPNVLLGCDGSGGYAFDQQENTYLRFEYPSTNDFKLKMPAGVLSTLLLQNPSLLFALSDTRILDAMEGFGDVKKVEDRTVNGTKCPVLQFGDETNKNSVQIAFDPGTHLIRQFTLNIKSEFAQGGEVMPGTASILVDYKAINSQQPQFPAGHFAWTPPAGAQNLLEATGSEPEP